jgi:hypothetical protein
LKSDHPSFLKLFLEKSHEVADRIALLRAYRDEDFANIRIFNEKLFGPLHQKHLKLATKKVLENPPLHPDKQEKILGKILTLDEVTERIEAYLANLGIENIPISISPTTFSRMAVAYQKDEVRINISQSGIIREHSLDAILEHEIGTHLRRYLAGKTT